MVRREILCALSLFVVLLFATFGWGHPGRLDSKGCHNVHKDFLYKSGKLVKAGTYHCHRSLGMMRLDGREALQNPEDSGSFVEEKSWWQQLLEYWEQEG